jgi:transcription antitermination factor NusG
MQNSSATDRKSIPHWYALYTRPNYEKSVAAEMEEKGLKSYLPLCTVLRQWSDRKKKVAQPLFSCYVFVHVTTKQFIYALQTRGVISMVAFNGSPAPIRDAEIDMIRKVLEKTGSFETAPYVVIGQLVEVIAGPFAGFRGYLLERHGKRKMLVGIEYIRQAISIEVNDYAVRPVPDAPLRKQVYFN